MLRGGAGAAIALPLLSAMGSKDPRIGHRRAQSGAAQRLLIYAQPLSIYAPLFFPTAPGGTPYDLVSTPIPSVFESGEGFLDNPDFELPEVLAPLADHRDDLLVIEGLDNCDGNHGAYSSTLTGIKGGSRGISIDQVVAQAIGNDTKFGSLQVGVFNRKAEDKHAVSWYGPDQPAAAEADPKILWDRLFADLQTDPAEAERLRAQTQSVLDAALGQATSLKSDLGAEDRHKLDNYLEAFRDVEKRLGNLPPMVCARPDAPDLPEVDSLLKGKTAGGADLVPEYARVQADLLAMAFACNLTHVATYQMLYEASNYHFPWLDITTRHHDMSHLAGKTETWTEDDGIPKARDYVKMSNWSMGMVSYLVQRLKDLDAYEGTVVAFFTPMGNGQRHNGRNIPLLALNGPGGPFKRGRHVRFSREGDIRQVNDLWVTVAQSLGVDLESHGDPEFNRGPLPELLA